MQPNIVAIHDFSHRSEQALALQSELQKLKIQGRITLSCGLNTIEKSVDQKRMGDVLISIGDPKKHYDSFDFLIIPSHEPQPTHKQIINSVGVMNRVNSRIDTLGHNIFTELPAPKLAVLLGGRHVGGDVTTADMIALAQKLNGFATSALITTSKRTEEGVLDSLKSLLNIPYSAYNFQKDGQVLNPYANILAEADALIVTADSLRMLSEACSTPKPTYIYQPEQLHFSYAALAQHLIEQGYAHDFSKLDATIKPTKQLDEAARIARILGSKIGK